MPVLAGLGAHQAERARTRSATRASKRFLDGVRALVESRPGRVVVVAGADLAHVGPRFGDAKPYDEGQRAGLEQADRASLERATALDAAAFWATWRRDLEERRVCGLAPIWSLASGHLGRSAAGGCSTTSRPSTPRTARSSATPRSASTPERGAAS